MLIRGYKIVQHLSEAAHLPQLGQGVVAEGEGGHGPRQLAAGDSTVVRLVVTIDNVMCWMCR